MIAGPKNMGTNSRFLYSWSGNYSCFHMIKSYEKKNIIQCPQSRMLHPVCVSVPPLVTDHWRAAGCSWAARRGACWAPAAAAGSSAPSAPTARSPAWSAAPWTTARSMASTRRCWGSTETFTLHLINDNLVILNTNTELYRKLLHLLLYICCID